MPDKSRHRPGPISKPYPIPKPRFDGHLTNEEFSKKLWEFKHPRQDFYGPYILNKRTKPHVTWVKPKGKKKKMFRLPWWFWIFIVGPCVFSDGGDKVKEIVTEKVPALFAAQTETERSTETSVSPERLGPTSTLFRPDGTLPPARDRAMAPDDVPNTSDGVSFPEWEEWDDDL